MPFDAAPPVTEREVMLFMLDDSLDGNSPFARVLGELNMNLFAYLEKAKSKTHYRVKEMVGLNSKICQNLISWYINN